MDENFIENLCKNEEHYDLIYDEIEDYNFLNRLISSKKIWKIEDKIKKNIKPDILKKYITVLYFEFISKTIAKFYY